MRVLGIDYGDSRIGIAVSDPNRIIAGALCIIDGTQGRKKAAAGVAELICTHEADTIVIGYPVHMNGMKGVRTAATEKFAKALQEACGAVLSRPIEIILWDERLTTAAADRAMLEMHAPQKKKGMNDMIAAVLILQCYLDSKRDRA